MPKTPTIKGVFVKSHLKALEKEYGISALEKLQQNFNRPIDFSDGEDVPVRTEVQLLETIVDTISKKKLTAKEREIEAGKLHFRNFATTPLWSVINSVFGQNFKLLLMQSPVIGGRVFNGVRFSSEDIGNRSVKIVMENNDYPLEHFLGFFEAWLAAAGLNGYVEGYARSEHIYEYVISWNESHITVAADR